MRGKIIKGIAGFYYVHVNGQGIYECKAKGVFRKNKEKPLVGDDVLIDILDDKEKTGNMIQIMERKNELIRPAVANIDQALIVFSVTKPEPNFNLLDRFLIMMVQKDIPCVLCFNKQDLFTEEQLIKIRSIYEKTGFHMYFISARLKAGIEELKECLQGKTTTVAGPSGVGKSSLINCLQSETLMQTGEISSKIERGKNTTRHTELIAIDDNTYILDTPGFSSLSIFDCEKEEIKDFYPEFYEYEGECRFNGCVHMNEPDCAVKKAVEKKEISNIRYENYRLLFTECQNKKKY